MLHYLWLHYLWLSAHLATALRGSATTFNGSHRVLPRLPAAPLPTSHAPRRAARPSPRLPLPSSTGRAACLDRRENTWICKVSREMPDLSCKAGIVDLQGTFRKVRAVCLRTSRFQFSIDLFFKKCYKNQKTSAPISRSMVFGAETC